MCTRSCMCGCVCIGACVEVRGQHPESFWFFHTLISRQGFSLNLELTNLAKTGLPASSRVSPASAFPALTLQVCVSVPGFLHGYWKSQPGAISILPNEPFPSLRKRVLKNSKCAFCSLILLLCYGLGLTLSSLCREKPSRGEGTTPRGGLWQSNCIMRILTLTSALNPTPQ